MMMVVDDAFDPPTIKYLIRCVGNGLLKLHTSSSALSSQLNIHSATSVAHMMQSHLHETIEQTRLSLSTLALVLDAMRPLDTL